MMQSHLRETLGSFTELHVPFAVVCAEISELDQLRSRYGQEAAVSLLQVLARTLRNTVWPTDFVGRWSEGRFLLILCGCGEDSLQAVAGRLRRMMSGVSITWWGEQLTVKVSIGSAGAVAGDSLESLMQRAQQALGIKPPEPDALAGAASSRSKS
jgi:diguanylate cyclase (GGDEF)-like protein